MQHKLRVSAAVAALALGAGCADSPVAPSTAAAPLAGGRQTTASAPTEYDWTFENKVFAILFGEHMLPEDRTDQTTIVPGDVKWIEYQFTANRTPQADVAGLTKDAKAKLELALIKPCTDIFPLLICTWGEPGLAPWTIDEFTQFLMIVDLHNFWVCVPDLAFTNKASLTELGPYPPGTTPQVHNSWATLIVKTGVCPPKPEKLGCTLTQGYWKNHSWPVHPLFPPQTLDQWAADNDWTFFDTGTDWKDILSVPTRGNEFYILAHQYIAAIMNGYNGAWVPPEVQAVLGNAYRWYTDAAFRASTPRETVIGWATLLDQYNNGKLGVPHCDDGGGKNKKDKKNA